MPNWCNNELAIRGKSADVDECLAAIRGEPEKPMSAHEAADEGSGPEIPPIDFNKIIPRAASLNITSGGCVSDAYAAWHGTDAAVQGILERSWVKDAGVTNREQLQGYLLRRTPDCKVECDAYAENLKSYGHGDWYGWSIANWGTKWNACDGSVLRDNKKRRRSVALSFSTAWSPPVPVITALIEKFPKLQFKLKYWECGACYQGVLAGEEGVVTEDESGDYHGRRGG